MSTRSVIARKTKEGFKGVYHHWDGYPSGLGAHLYGRLQEQFKWDVQALLAFAIDSVSSWSTMMSGKNGEGTPHDPSKAAAPLTHEDAAGCGCEYAYVFDEEATPPVMIVLSSYNDNGKKMIGMFGCGNDKATWKEIGRVALDGSAKPDFEKMGYEE